MRFTTSKASDCGKAEVYREDTRKTGALLWTVQGLLALIFLFAGSMKLVLPIEEMTQEMELPQVVRRLLLPADEDAPEAVHPAVTALHDPAACLVPGLPLDRLGLFPAGADMTGVAELVH